MKKNLFGITAFIVISLVFISCPDPGSGGHKHTNNPDQKAFVVFDNTYGICTALVYDDYRRRDMDRIAEIPAGKSSAEFECTPNVSIPFYFAYRITLKDISGFTVDFVPEIGKDQRAVRLNADTRTVIPIPALDEAVTSQQQVLSHKSYLTIQNNSNYSFQLHRGFSMIRPDNFPDSGVVNSGERAPYTINPGRSSDYRLLVGTDYQSFPDSPDRFEAGNFYSYIFNTNVSIDTHIPINLDNVDIPTYSVSFNSNGGSGTVPVSQSVRAASGITLPLGNELSKGDEIFGGWCTDASGAGVIYSAGTRYTVTGDITLYAKWYPAGTTLYTVTFDSAGGIETASQSMVSGAVAIRPPDPYRTGYTFGGWYRDQGTQNPYDFAAPVTGSFTLYAAWNANRYTVTFHANGADGAAPAAVTVDYGVGITLPTAGGLSKPYRTFDGWNTEDDGAGIAYNSGAQYTVSADVTLFAVWYEDGQTFAVSTPAEFSSALSSIQSSSDTNFTVVFTADMGLGPNNLGGEAYKNKIVALRGDTPARAIRITSSGSLFTVGAEVELIIKDIVLRGRTDNNASLLTVNTDGKLVLNSGEISGNTSFPTSGGRGGGVYVSGGTFTMTGGKISGNTASGSGGGRGGGVYVDGGTFTMSGGEISGNTLSGSSGLGGGVFIDGTFTMTGGKISGNTTSYNGGGVFVTPVGIFTMSGGEISNNTASSYGGGIYIYGTFTMTGGEISGNTLTGSDATGGGVFVVAYGTFTMTGGKISSNTLTGSSASGGGVYVSNGSSFTMNGGEISGNTATYRGGGVYVSGTFRIVTGTVYGSNEGALSNTAGTGAALYNSGTVQYGTFSGETWNSNGNLNLTAVDTTFKVVNGRLISINNIGTITASTWHEGKTLALAAPYVYFIPGLIITAQGWQTSDNGNDGWTNFTPSIVNLSYNGKYLRYYAASNDGSALYSNVVPIRVLALDEYDITVEMWDSYINAWNGALRINVNGIDLSENAEKISYGRGPDFYTFVVNSGDKVIFYLIAGYSNGQNAFAVYYSDDPPNPAYDPTSGTAVDTGRILIYRQYGDMGSAAEGEVLGSFTVP